MIEPEVRSVPVERVAGPPLWRDLPVLITLIVALVHFVRGAPVDGLIFVSVGVGLVVAEPRDGSAPRAGGARSLASGRRLGTRWVLLGALLCVVYGVVVGSRVPASVPVKLAVILPGLLILPLAWRVGPPSRAPRPGGGRWVWAGVVVLVCLWELNSFLRQPDPRTASYDHPTLSAILGPPLESPVVRSVALVGWLAVGMWLARTLATPPDKEEP